MPSPPPADTARFRLVAFGFVGLFALAVYSQARVQWVDRASILAEAKDSSRYEIERSERARRGNIVSSDGKVLAQTVDAFELSLDYRRVPLSPGFFLALAEASGVPEPELREPGLQGRRSRVWRRPLSQTQARAVRDVKSSWRADGLSLVPVLTRTYPLAEATSAIVGTIRDGRPLNGLELSQNDTLAGEDGESLGFIDRTGVFVRDESAPKEAGRPGQNLELTIDSGLQMTATQAVRTVVEAHKARSGTAVVMDPKTGNVLAMASWPSFDPTGTMTKGADFLPATMGAYEPGSTFKILTLAEAMEAGVVGGQDRAYCNGSITVGGRTIRCAEHNGVRAHGQVDPERAIAVSCNVTAARWSMAAGRVRMVKLLEDLGLLRKTELGLPLERGGLFNRNEYAKTLQLANIGFGQSLNATPVALASAYAMLANGGVRMEPRLIARVGDQATPVREFGRIVAPEVADEVLRMMEAVIEEDFGTGHKLRIPGYTLAGKTGTAQKLGTGGAANAGYVSNFVGYVPARDPKAVVLVMIDAPTQGGYYGGVVAGPAFVEIARALIRRYDIPPDAPVGAPVSAPRGPSAERR